MWFSTTEPGFESPYRYQPSPISRSAPGFGWQARGLATLAKAVRRSCERSERLAKADDRVSSAHPPVARLAPANRHIDRFPVWRDQGHHDSRVTPDQCLSSRNEPVHHHAEETA